jgi:hypothetical protein
MSKPVLAALIAISCSMSPYVHAAQLQPSSLQASPPQAPTGASIATLDKPKWVDKPWSIGPESTKASSAVMAMEKAGRLTAADIKKLKFAAELPSSNELSIALYGEGLSLGYLQRLDVSDDVFSFDKTVPTDKANVSRAFARSVFLGNSIPGYWGIKWVLQLGARLLMEDPNDYYVLLGMCVDGPSDRSLKDKAASLKYVARMKVLKPHNPVTYYAEYVVYFRRAIALGDVPDYDEAITALKRVDEMEGHTSKTIPERLKRLESLRDYMLRVQRQSKRRVNND